MGRSRSAVDILARMYKGKRLLREFSIASSPLEALSGIHRDGSECERLTDGNSANVRYNPSDDRGRALYTG